MFDKGDDKQLSKGGDVYTKAMYNEKVTIQSKKL